MCGIGVWLEWINGARPQWNTTTDGAPNLGAANGERCAPRGAFETVPVALSRRGPDCCSPPADALWNEAPPNAVLGGDADGLHVRLCGAVLHLRGADGAPVPQPVRTSGGELLFNGEIFGLDSLSEDDACCTAEESVRPTARGEFLGRGQSDTQWLAQRLDTVHSGPRERLVERVRDALEPLQGPYAVIYWAAEARLLICARDSLGRRSLVHAVDETGGLCIASVPPADRLGAADGWSELPCGVVCIDLANSSQPSVSHLTWREARPPFVSPSWWPSNAEVPERAVHDFRRVLQRAVSRRVLTIPEPPPPNTGKVGILFSGGLDSTVLAALAAEALRPPGNGNADPAGAGACAGQTIELINIAFEPAAPDRITALLSYEDLVSRYGPNVFRLLCIDVAPEEVVAAESEVLALLGTAEHRTHLDFNIACALYFAARGQNCRLCGEDYFDRSWWTALASSEEADAVVSERARVSERESAAGAAEAADVTSGPCSVCNSVSKPRCIHKACKLCCKKLREAATAKDDASDRPISNRAAAIAAKLASVPVEERHATCPVHRDKGSDQPAAQVADADEENHTLAGPGVVELSAGHYFAEGPQESATCRVLLLGSGADELLGGYARHVTAMRKRGHEALRNEMLMDLRRLWTRNLGRDDRVISAFGREPRHPFLDEEVLRFVGALPLPALLGPVTPSGRNVESSDQGSASPCEPVTKWILRQVAEELGLHRAANFKKRAIQFGSRVAKGSNIRHFGTNRKARGDVQYTPQAAN